MPHLPNRQAGPIDLAARIVRGAIAAILVCLMPALPALAQKPQNITQGEIALLPVYCPDTQGFSYGDAYFNTSPRAAYWIRLMDSKSFWALHHYCWALIKIRRAEAVGLRPEIREGLRRSALGDYDYVLENGSRDFVLLPELLLRRAEVLIKLNDVGTALQSVEAAVARKPDYWPAYVSWAEYLQSIKRNKDAQTFLERGLAQSPKEPKLHAAYRKAGGDPESFVRKLPPPPVAPASAPASAPAATTAEAATAPASAASDGR